MTGGRYGLRNDEKSAASAADQKGAVGISKRAPGITRAYRSRYWTLTASIPAGCEPPAIRPGRFRFSRSLRR